MGGFDYETLAEKLIRDGRRLAQVGRCTGPVEWRGPIVVDDLRFLLTQTTSPVKVTLPGPMTVTDSTFDAYYGDERAFAMAMAAARIGCYPDNPCVRPRTTPCAWRSTTRNRPASA